MKKGEGHKLRKIFFWITFMFLTFTSVILSPSQIVNAQTFQDGNFYYSVYNNIVTVTGVVDEPLTNVVIPSTVTDGVNTYNVTRIGYRAFAGKTNLQGDLTISEGIQIIDSYAFDGCTGFTGTLTLPQSLKTIGTNAFYGNNGFTGTLSIPQSVTSSGSGAFQGCSGFSSLSIPEGLTTISDRAFAQCSGLTGTLSIPQSVTSIGSYAFQGCKGLTGNLTVSQNVTLGNGAFYDCSGFTSLFIADGVTMISDSAFYGCSGFTGTLTIPQSVKSIGSSSFSNCNGFTGILNIPQNVTSMGTSAFSYCSGFSGLSIGEGLTTISDYAFRNCTGFTGALIIPESITSIGSYAFDHCSGFYGPLNLPQSLTSIGSSAFYGCSGLYGTLVIPENVTSIGSYAFSSCSGFTGTLVIPQSVTSIGSGAFSSCKGLTSLSLSEGITTIANGTFRSCGFKGTVTLPESVTVIQKEAFYYCSQLTGVVFGNNVTDIGESAFANTALSGTLEVPDSVIRIQNKAFYSCSGIKKVELGSSLTTIGYQAFDGCRSLSGTLNIPDNVISIGYEAFENSSLESLRLGKSLENIGYSAFQYNSKLTSIFSYPAVAPTTEDNVFLGVSAETTLFAPNRLAEDTSYSLPPWNSFKFSASPDLPQTPSDLEAISTNYNSLTLKWSPSESVSGYQVFRSNYPNDYYGLLTTTTESQYLVTGLPTGTPMYYKIRAFRSEENNTVYGLYSSPISATTILPPTTVTVDSITKNTVALRWQKVDGATGYEIYRSDDLTDAYKLVGNTDGLIFDETSLETGITYHYKVRAYRGSSPRKYSVDSNVIDVTPTLLDIPTGVKLTGNYNQILVSWAPVDGATGYQVYRSTSLGGTYSQYITTSNTSYLNNKNITIGSTYHYKIRSYRTMGTAKIYSDFTEPASVKADLGVPGGLEVSSTAPDRITVSWAAVEGATGYQVHRSTSQYGSYSLYTTTTNTSYVNSLNVKPGIAYFYKVRAYRTAVYGRYYGDFSDVITGVSKLGISTILTAASTGYNSIDVEWSAVASATGYQVYRSSTIGGAYSLYTTTSSTKYTNKAGVVTGQTYYYKIRAYRTNLNGRDYGDDSQPVSAKAIPAAPENLTALRVNSTSIQVSWNSVLGAHGYQIYRSESQDGTFSLYSTRTGTTYLNSVGVISGRTYYYKVRSYRTMPSGRIYSAFSEAFPSAP